jgi:hypothetical protein
MTATRVACRITPLWLEAYLVLRLSATSAATDFNVARFMGVPEMGERQNGPVVYLGGCGA